jgi:hypothetical protein
MIRSGNARRFNSSEVDELRRIGLDVAGVKCQHDIDREVTRWASALANERFHLLEQLAAAMAEMKGLRLPPKLGRCDSSEE